MKSHWHEQIQLHMDGQLSAAESAALSEALSQDAEFRALYLDYMNLDAALSAMAGAPAVAAGGASRPAATATSPARRSPSHWRWFAPAAACLALVLIGVLSKTRDAARARPAIGAVTASARTAISNLRAELPLPLPKWMSPTAPLLNDSAYRR
jgi:anti-sigma factor RsiW